VPGFIDRPLSQSSAESLPTVLRPHVHALQFASSFFHGTDGHTAGGLHVTEGKQEPPSRRGVFSWEGQEFSLDCFVTHTQMKGYPHPREVLSEELADLLDTLAGSGLHNLHLVALARLSHTI
jgi:hypothetical protein